MSEPVEFKLFLESCEKAARRSRAVLVVLIIVSIVIFSAAWKETSFSWLKIGVSNRLAALELIDSKEALKVKSDEISFCRKVIDLTKDILTQHSPNWVSSLVNFKLLPNKYCGNISVESLRTIVERCKIDTPCDQPSLNIINDLIPILKAEQAALQSNADALQTRVNSNEFERAELVIKYYRKDREVSYALLKKLFDLDLQNRMKILDEHERHIHLPFFGILLHVNDLGLLGGFAIFIVLLWMRSALDDELRNLRISRDFIERHTDSNAEKLSQPRSELNLHDDQNRINPRNDMFRLLSLIQFPMRPPTLDKSCEILGFHWLRRILIGIICLPIIVEIFLFFIDITFDTQFYGLESVGFMIVLVGSGIFLGLNSMLTCFAIASILNQAKVWTEIHSIFNNLHPRSTPCALGTGIQASTSPIAAAAPIPPSSPTDGAN